MVSESVHPGEGRRVSPAEWLTVERAAYAALALLALVVRFVELARFPLWPAEAGQAVEAVAAAAGQPYSVAGLSPLLFSGQRVLFLALGADEFLARWWTALCGGLAIVAFYYLRDRLTRGGALMAAFLWAVSPVAALVGRLGLGDGLTPAFALLLLAGINQTVQAGGHDANGARRLPPVAAAIALGLLLASGPSAYTVVLVALLALFWWPAGASALWAALRPLRRDLLVAGVGAFVLGSSFFLLSLDGLAAAAELLGRWLSGLAPTMGEYSAWEIIRRLLLSEPLLLGFAIAGIVRAIRRGDRFGIYVGIGAALALLIAVVGNSRVPNGLGLPVLGAVLLAGPALAAALRPVIAWRGQIDPWLLLALELILIFTATQCLPAGLHPNVKPDWVQVYASIGILTAGMALALWLVYGFFGSWRIVAEVLPIVLLVVGLTWGVGQLTALNFDQGAGRQSGVFAVAADAGGVAALRAELDQLASLKGTGAREGRVDLVIPLSEAKMLLPVLRWTTRSLPNVRVLGALPADRAPLVVTIADKAAAPGEAYGGTEIAILRRWRLRDQGSLGAWVRWLAYRETAAAPQLQKVVLWLDRSTPSDKK